MGEEWFGESWTRSQPVGVRLSNGRVVSPIHSLRLRYFSNTHSFTCQSLAFARLPTSDKWSVSRVLVFHAEKVHRICTFQGRPNNTVFAAAHRVFSITIYYTIIIYYTCIMLCLFVFPFLFFFYVTFL